MDSSQAQQEINSLSEKLHRYQYQYYVEARPEVSDLEYDRMLNRLTELEKQFPNLVRPDSPSFRVGSDLTSEFPEVEHTIPVLSLGKAYSTQDVLTWMHRIEKQTDMHFTYIVEEKIDGVSIVLYYENGSLDRAITRGNGYVGNDVTSNVKTIGSVPLRLNYPETVAVRGEIFLPTDKFNQLNERMETPFANPRNLAAGTLRRQKSSEVAPVPLDMFAYEGVFAEKSPERHIDILSNLQTLGFKVNKRIAVLSREHIPENHGFPDIFRGNLEDLGRFIEKETGERSGLTYEIDGLVIKIDNIPIRNALGYTGHHPRWAVAYKFESPEGETTVNNIEVQVGRTGRITPVARVNPVEVGGSTIQNVTLHNQSYIEMLELAVGDTVAVSKRGDVIPAVERVIEKNKKNNTTWHLPENCPSCGNVLTVKGAHHFCTNFECPDQVRGRLHFFVAQRQMDIRNIGPETVDFLLEKGLVRTVSDLYHFDPEKLQGEEGFGERKIELMREGIEKSKKKPFQVVLASLGIPELGPKNSELLINEGYNSIDKLLNIADKYDTELLARIDGIGEKTAEIILESLRDEHVRKIIEELRRAGLNLQITQNELKKEEYPPVFEGQVWCATGSFERFQPRAKAMEEVKKRGGRTVSSVTGKTTHLLAGENPGSKVDKARKAGARIVTEEEFLSMLNKC